MTLPQTPWTYEVCDDPRVRLPNDRITIPGTVKVEAVAGYDTVPQSIKHAALLLCDHFYENKEITSNFKGKENEIPFSVSTLLYPYTVLRR